MSHSNHALGSSSAKSCPFTVLLSLKTKRTKRGTLSRQGFWNRAIFLYPSVSLILSAPFFPKWWLGKQAVKPNWFFFVVMDKWGDRLKSSMITFLTFVFKTKWMWQAVFDWRSLDMGRAPSHSDGSINIQSPTEQITSPQPLSCCRNTHPAEVGGTDLLSRILSKVFSLEEDSTENRKPGEA